MGSIYQINVKPHRSKERGIPKRAVETVDVALEGLVGDYNVYRTEKKQRDLNNAVMLLPLETIEQLHSERFPIAPGHLGENFTTRGIEYEEFRVGNIYVVGHATIEITEPCQPCTSLQILPYVGPDNITEFMRTLVDRRGWYAKVLIEGTVRKGENIDVLVP